MCVSECPGPPWRRSATPPSSRYQARTSLLVAGKGRGQQGSMQLQQAHCACQDSCHDMLPCHKQLAFPSLCSGVVNAPNSFIVNCVCITVSFCLPLLLSLASIFFVAAYGFSCCTTLAAFIVLRCLCLFESPPCVQKAISFVFPRSP